MALGALLSEFSRASLIGQLHKSERWLEPVNKHHLYVLFVDGCVDLVKQLDEQVVREIIIGPEHMDPCALILRIGIKNEPVQLIGQREILRQLVIDSSFDQLKIQIEIVAEAVGNTC